MNTTHATSLAFAGLLAIAGTTLAHDPEPSVVETEYQEVDTSRPHFGNQLEDQAPTLSVEIRIDTPDSGDGSDDNGLTPQRTPFGISPVPGDAAPSLGTKYRQTQHDPAFDEPGSGNGLPFGDALPAACRADLDDSGAVDTMDIVLLLSSWGTCRPTFHDDGPSVGDGRPAPQACDADISQDGFVDFDDLLALLAQFGERCR